jgi:hypothetical protein
MPTPIPLNDDGEPESQTEELKDEGSSVLQQQ